MERKIVMDVVGRNQEIHAQQETHPKSSFLSRERREERKEKVFEEAPFSKIMRDKRGGGSEFAWWHAVLIVLAIFAVIVTWLTLNAEATVLVSPREKVLAIDSTLKAYLNPDTPLLLGFSLKELSDSDSLEVKSTGTKYVERKANGKLIVYNLYSKEAVKIVANTRFKSTNGLIFRTYSSFFVPGFKGTGASKQPGQIEISVTADLAGSDYNMGVAEFTLPGLDGSAMAGLITAKSLEPMTGGFKGEAAVIAEEDLEKAKDTLRTSLAKSLVEKTRSGLAEGSLLPDGAYTIEYIFDEYDPSKSSEGEKTLTMKGTIKAITLDAEMLSRVIARRELAGVGDEGVLIENFPELDLELGSYENLGASKEISLRLRGDARFVWQFSKTALAKDLSGKPKEDYSRVFSEYPGIESATVDVKPFWKGTFPSDPQDIVISTKGPQ